MKKVASILIALLIMTSMMGCGTSEAESAQDYWPTDGWRTSTPEEQDMDSAILHQMMGYFDEEELRMDSVVVVRNGYIVFENYWGNNDEDKKHECFSVTKSFTSALIGIALKEGYIESLDQKMLDFFPEYSIQNMDTRKEEITLEHLLMMKDGFDWNEILLGEILIVTIGDILTNALAEILDNPETDYQIESKSDFVQYVLDRPMAAEPGTRWNYNTGTSQLLSAIVHETTGYDTLDFAQEFLFSPLGINDVVWLQEAQGIRFGGFGLSLTPRDMAKFGLLYLNNGAWDGEQIVPADYVTSSVETYSSLSSIEGYGYHWWTFPTLEGYGAVGLGGQFIGVFPEINTVVVFTAKLFENLSEDWMVEHYYQILSEYIIESCN
jgi:CubicO group peptidase (beta-lactamase class C family)